MYALNLDKETNRILSVWVVLPTGNYDGMPIVDSFPEHSNEYLYIDGEFVHDPLPEPETSAPEATAEDRLEAQVLYTAMMTDTLLEE